MGLHKVKRGLRLPIVGEPVQEIDVGRAPAKVAVLGDDYVGMRPTMKVAVGDTVKRGQVLFEDKKTLGVRYTSPGAGRVAGVNRGAKRVFQSIVVELSRDEREGRSGAAEEVSFKTYTGRPAGTLNGEQVRELLLESGQWTALRGRPYGRVAHPENSPRSIFVTASDSNPLAPRMNLVLAGHERQFQLGLEALAKLTQGPVWVCVDADLRPELPDGDQFRLETFTGPHPAGTAGVHIHELDPVNRAKTVWHLGLQDVIAIGYLFDTGKLWVERVISLAGPMVERPRLLRTRLGASTDDLTRGELKDGECRVISGSVFSGRTAMGEAVGFLGRYQQQISVLEEGRKREFVGWLAPGPGRYSVLPTYLSAFMPGKKFAFTTTTNGSHRAVIPLGVYEKVMPMDLEPTFLLKSLLMGDVEVAEKLGCLELGEEDVALCSFVCPGKNDYGPHLREVLNTIEKEG